MFYIYADGKSIYQPMDDTLTLLSPRLTLEMGKAGSLQFNIPPSNKYYNSLPQLTTIVTVELDDVEIFRGRVLSNNRNFNNTRTIYCEGDLAYLVDSVQKGEKYEGKTHDLFRRIVAAHNSRVESSKQFVVGNIGIENRDVILVGKSDDIVDEETGKFDYKQIAINSIADEYRSSFDYIETCLIDYCGGYLRTRRVGSITYLDLVTEYGTTAVQEIEFGKNMLDLTEEVSAEEVFSVLIPLGDENLTIASVNNGSDELVDTAAVARYGRIVRTHVFDSVNKPETLLENGKRYLASNVNVPITVTVKAVDLHLIDPNTSGIYLGDKVHVNSIPHDMVEYLTCTKIEYDMENPANNTYTFGNPRQSLTERYRKDKSKAASSSSRGGRGGGAASEEAAEEAKQDLDRFYDAWINVDPSAAHIDLGTLYKELQDGKSVLEQTCGINIDAPSGNINIKNFRQEFDTLGNVVREQGAYINLINDDTKAQIELITSNHKKLEDVESSHYAEFIMYANDTESAIKLKADKVTVDAIQVDLRAASETITKTNDVLTMQCGISLDGSKANVNITTLQSKVNEHGDQISKNTTSISSLSTSTSASIQAVAKTASDNGTKIASLELRTTANESSIRLKADTTTLNSKVTTINSKITTITGDITDIQSEITKVKKLIADEIDSVKGNIDWLTSKSITLQVGVYAPYVRASKDLTLAGKPVATKEWVTDTYGNAATQAWVEGKGYLTSLPDTITVKKVKATDSMAIGIYTVATQYWCQTTKKFATQDWVTEQLKNYSKTGHTHALTKHRHSISLSIANGHTHKYQRTTNGTQYNTTGVSTNATHTVSTYTGYTGS